MEKQFSKTFDLKWQKKFYDNSSEGELYWRIFMIWICLWKGVFKVNDCSMKFALSGVFSLKFTSFIADILLQKYLASNKIWLIKISWCAMQTIDWWESIIMNLNEFWAWKFSLKNLWWKLNIKVKSRNWLPSKQQHQLIN